jgi:hypothetical protein
MWGHVRKFAIGELKELFPRACLLEKRFFTPKEVKIPGLPYVIAKKAGNIWKCDQGDSRTCPNCNGQPLNSVGNILGQGLMRLIWRFQKASPFKKPIWIGCLYGKMGAE